MSSDGSTLIDGNGNDLEVHATEVSPGFLTNIWKKVRSNREATSLKYEVRYQQKKEDINLNNRCSAPSNNAITTTTTITASSGGSIWSKLSAFTSHEKLDSAATSVCTSIENSPHNSPGVFPQNKEHQQNQNYHHLQLQLHENEQQQCLLPQQQQQQQYGSHHQQQQDQEAGDVGKRRENHLLDNVYGELPKTKTNRKVYSTTNENPDNHYRVKTRRESLFGDNRRNRNVNARLLSSGDNKNEVVIQQRGHNPAFRHNSNSSSATSPQPSSEGKRVSFQPEPSEFANQCWDIRSRVISRENFYNVNEVDMAALYKSGRQSDVTIRCRGRDFRVHSFVLKAQSGHFRRALFMKTDFAEPIVINDMTQEDMAALLQYMYTGRIDESYFDGHDFERMVSRFEFMLQDYDVPYPDESSR